MYQIATQKAQPIHNQLTEEARILGVDPARVIQEMPTSPEYQTPLPQGVIETEVQQVMTANPTFSRDDAIKLIVAKRAGKQ